MSECRLRWRATCIGVATFALLLFSAAAAASDDAWQVALFPSGAAFQLEIAADPQTRARGYMHREKVGAAEGMLFVFEAADFHAFWMKNCLVSLDIIWLDERFRVVDIALELPPCAEGVECPNVYPMGAARYALEVAAGTTRREGLRRGDQLVLLPEPTGS